MDLNGIFINESIMDHIFENNLYIDKIRFSYINNYTYKRYRNILKNTSETTLDGDLPFIVTMTAPTVAVPTTKGISKLTIDQKGTKKKIIPKKYKK